MSSIPTASPLKLKAAFFLGALLAAVSGRADGAPATAGAVDRLKGL